MDEKKIVNLEEDLTTEHTNEPVSLEEQAEQKMQKTILTTDQQTEKVLADEPEVELVDENEMPNEQAQEVPLVLDANITSEEEIEIDHTEEINQINAQIQQTYAKYKRTMIYLVACFVIYIVFMFVVKESWSVYVVLANCVAMIALAVYDTRLTRKIRRLATERGRLMEESKVANGQAVATDLPMVENAQSLNDLPRQFTVLDDIEFEDGTVAEHIVVSPYGIAVVGNESLKENVLQALDQCGVDQAEELVTFYDPNEETSELVQKILQVNVNCLDERQIMQILLNLTGLSK